MLYELPQMKYPEQNGLISIIVPIYNNEIYLRECLNSILAQTFKNWEGILVNDGSTDNTGKIIDEYVQKDSRFIAIHKQNEGTLLARKTGLENSKGEFIANIDHDDVYNPQFLEKMHSKIIETNVDFVWCRCQDKNFYVTEYEWNKDVSKNVEMILTFMLGASLVTWDKLIKREVYAKVYFPCKNIIWGEDPIQMIQIAYHSKSAKFISENLYFHRLMGCSSAPKSVSIILAAFIIIEILENLFKGIIPQNVREAFHHRFGHISKQYFFLDKKHRQQIRNEVEPFLSKCIKDEKKLYLKIFLFLASKGFVLPLRIRWKLSSLKTKIASIIRENK